MQNKITVYLLLNISLLLNSCNTNDQPYLDIKFGSINSKIGYIHGSLEGFGIFTILIQDPLPTFMHHAKTHLDENIRICSYQLGQSKGNIQIKRKERILSINNQIIDNFESGILMLQKGESFQVLKGYFVTTRNEIYELDIDEILNKANSMDL